MPNEREEMEKKFESARSLEVGRIVQLSNQRGDLYARLLIADEIVKLRAELTALKSSREKEMREAWDESAKRTNLYHMMGWAGSKESFEEYMKAREDEAFAAFLTSKSQENKEG